MTAEPPVAGLYRLLAWLSPSFPTGAFSYSHSLEAAIAGGVVRDRAGLEAWVAAVVTHGSGRIDADILCNAYRATVAGDLAALDTANRRGAAFRATAELALEAAQQGGAFLATCRAAWPEPFIEEWAADPRQAAAGAAATLSGNAGEGAPGRSPRARKGICHSAVFGAVTERAGIALDDAVVGYLQAFAANLVSAGLRLGIVGQTDGQRILRALEPVVAGAGQAAMVRDPKDFGGATFAVDLSSMAHEAQYTRLFRS